MHCEVLTPVVNGKWNRYRDGKPDDQMVTIFRRKNLFSCTQMFQIDGETIDPVFKSILNGQKIKMNRKEYRDKYGF